MTDENAATHDIWGDQDTSAAADQPAAAPAAAAAPPPAPTPPAAGETAPPAPTTPAAADQPAAPAAAAAAAPPPATTPPAAGETAPPAPPPAADQPAAAPAAPTIQFRHYPIPPGVLKTEELAAAQENLRKNQAALTAAQKAAKKDNLDSADAEKAESDIATAQAALEAERDKIKRHNAGVDQDKQTFANLKVTGAGELDRFYLDNPAIDKNSDKFDPALQSFFVIELAAQNDAYKAQTGSHIDVWVDPANQTPALWAAKAKAERTYADLRAKVEKEIRAGMAAAPAPAPAAAAPAHPATTSDAAARRAGIASPPPLPVGGAAPNLGEMDQVAQAIRSTNDPGAAVALITARV